MSRPFLRLCAFLLALAVWGAAWTLPAAAQEQPRIALVVDYVGEEGVYLAAGTDQGLRAGDVLQVFPSSERTAQPLGRLVVVTTSKKRSVAKILPPEFALERGTTLYTVRPRSPVEEETPEPAAVRPSEAEAAAAARSAQAARRSREARTGGASSPRVATNRSPRVSGRLTMDVDARETRTSWAALTSGKIVRRFVTPTTRLTLKASNLPGGWTLQANVRGSYRYSDGGVFSSPQSFRFYGLSMSKTFETLPLRVRLGRFSNPYESYSAYWDGALVRVGGTSGPGVGVVAGYEPSRYNEGISTTRPKVTAFADYSVRRGRLRYSTNLSYHVIRPTDAAFLDRTFVGWTQRIGISRFTFDQRVQLDREPVTGTWTLARLRLRGTLRLSDRVQLRGGIGRSKPSYLRPASLLVEGERRDQENVGVTITGSRGQISVDVGATEKQGQQRGVSISAAGSWRSGRVQLYGSGRRWKQGDASSISVVPGMGYRWGTLRMRAAYQFYRTSGLQSLQSQSFELTFSRPIRRGLHATVRAQQQWGSSFTGTRLRMSIARVF
jgi:hypothetical protein